MEEILRAPVEVGNLSHYLQVFDIQTVVGLGISEPSTVAPVSESGLPLIFPPKDGPQVQVVRRLIQ